LEVIKIKKQVVEVWECHLDPTPVQQNNTGLSVPKSNKKAETSAPKSTLKAAPTPAAMHAVVQSTTNDVPKLTKNKPKELTPKKYNCKINVDEPPL